MKRALVWFRSDLRVADHTALARASRVADALSGVFLLSPEQWREHDWGGAKVDFVLRNVDALSRRLARIGIPLRVRSAPRFADAPDALLHLASEEGCEGLFFNREYEVNERRRDRRVRRMFEDRGLAVHDFHDQTIVPPGSLRTGGGGFYKVFTPFRRSWLDRLLREPLPAPSAAPATRGSRVKGDTVPETLPGFEPAPAARAGWPSGEDEASRRLDAFVAGRIGGYARDRDKPAMDGTSGLSPYLACGVLSPRQCLAAAADVNTGQIDSGDPGVRVWISELVWREFYRHVLVGFPRVSMGRPFDESTDSIPWSVDETRLARWREGRTGVPIVDAGMRQLRETGWMHNRLRMIVAMYLSKNLFLDWRLGERHFMRHLVDADLANNNGGWQWSASTGCDAAPYFRLFNPIRQSERYDPDGSFIRRYCPELGKLGGKAIHDPSRLSRAERRGLDYPEPLVDLARSRERAVAAFGRLKRPRRPQRKAPGRGR